ncbi:HAMP domain-containing histidine kinase [Ktedonosporobacter rubrisoli]|uniref:histidine kinase n=1 Tax=Ktedonosporobacter rubrisoli TaxID=2509675 RepID=A0A4P6K2S4_KTERU|nr:HAMP domain-containing sensor histidine kinase [Ktedonosporobacter rubrisoli]QBD81786.1 HAMP domain-containing histidine kinase [Ktedonosporobacter rubrisoli]
MSAQLRLHELTSRIHHLLECSGVSLVLNCPEVALRHPLLSLFFLTCHCPMIYSDALTEHALLENERIWALCDIALQSGRCVGYRDEFIEKAIGSLAIAPLERPAGILGFLICINTQPYAFGEGEHLLLEQYLPIVAQHVESILGDACIPSAREDVESDIVTDVREQSEFISLVSHELRVPLTAIKGYAGLLQAYSVADLQDQGGGMRITAARQQHYLDIIMAQVKHLEVLVGDLLDVSRLQAGRLALRCTRVDLAQICRYVAQLMQYRLEQQQPGRYHIRCNIDSALPYAWADPDRVQQVLTNLVENAVKYSPEGGLIEILAYTCVARLPLTKDYRSSKRIYATIDANHKSINRAQTARILQMAYITVRDQGIGIPAHLQGSLFRPFTRLNQPHAGQVTGVGVGLYISRKLVEAMQGQISLESSEGQGTSVTFTLPAEDQDKE